MDELINDFEDTKQRMTVVIYGKNERDKLQRHEV